MVKHSKQNWEIGDRVKIGFMGGLTILAKVPTPSDYAPDAYVLRNTTGTFYRFVPHKGIERRASMQDALEA